MSKQMTQNEAMLRIDQAVMELTSKNVEAADRILKDLISDTIDAGNLSEELHGPDLRRMSMKCVLLAAKKMNIKLREKA